MAGTKNKTKNKTNGKTNGKTNAQREREERKAEQQRMNQRPYKNYRNMTKQRKGGSRKKRRTLKYK